MNNLAVSYRDAGQHVPALKLREETVGRSRRRNSDLITPRRSRA